MMRREISGRLTNSLYDSQRENTTYHEIIPTRTPEKAKPKLEKTTSSLIVDLSLVRLLALLEIRIAYGAEIPGTRAYNNDISIGDTPRGLPNAHLSWPPCHFCAPQNYHLLRFLS